MRKTDTVIDADKCTGCGRCVKVCPSRTIALRDGKAVVVGATSLGCGHCEAACPEGAVKVGFTDDAAFDFATFAFDRTWLPPGQYDPAGLARLMASRRSCRNYADRAVDRAVLDDLVRFGTLAPSGTNSQEWTFTILPDRATVLKLGERVAAFFDRLVRLSRIAPLRAGLRLLGRPELHAFHREYADDVAEGLREWRAGGKDRLFHGAPAVLLIGSRRGASLPVEDALLASQNVCLAAHAMGLGTCLIGFVVEAMKHDRTIGAGLGLPAGERVHAAVTIGHPAERYERVAGRRKVEPRVIG